MCFWPFSSPLISHEAHKSVFIGQVKWLHAVHKGAFSESSTLDVALLYLGPT